MSIDHICSICFHEKVGPLSAPESAILETIQDLWNVNVAGASLCPGLVKGWGLDRELPKYSSKNLGLLASLLTDPMFLL